MNFRNKLGGKHHISVFFLKKKILNSFLKSMCFICVSHLKEFPTISPFSPYNVISQTIKIKKKKTEHYNCKKRRGVN